MANCCDCFRRCCTRSSLFKSRLVKYKRFGIALQRLSEENDIQRNLSHNRISYIANKSKFKSTQRLTVNYSRKFIISDLDMRATRDEAAVIKIDSKEWVIEEFDPEENETDRRLLYQITGLRFNEDDFIDSASEISENLRSDDSESSNDSLAPLFSPTTKP